MKVSYTGISQELPQKSQRKLENKFAKLAKLLDSRGEHKAHVVVKQQRQTYRAEATVQFYDHQFVGTGSDTDLFTAVLSAVEKLDLQAHKHRAKWHDAKRQGASAKSLAPAEPAVTAKPSAAKKKAPSLKKTRKDDEEGRVVRVKNPSKRKPITLEEAMLEIGAGQDYLTYHDADRDRVSVLIRRRDGSFDLIEA